MFGFVEGAHRRRAHVALGIDAEHVFGNRGVVGRLDDLHEVVRPERHVNSLAGKVASQSRFEIIDISVGVENLLEAV